MAIIDTIKYKKIVWLDIKHPNGAQIRSLRKKYKFHELDIEDCLSKTERPKIDEYEKYLFIILHLPYYNKRFKRIETEEIKIFIGQNYLITIHENILKTLQEIIEKSKKQLKERKELLGEGSDYLLYEIINRLFDDCFFLIDELASNIKEVEKDVFTEEMRQKDMLKDILLLKKNTINFRRIIFPQRTVLAQLRHKNKKFISEDLQIYFDNVVDKIEKIWNSLENLKEIAETLEDTNKSIISHNINSVMKTLTIFSVIMLPLTFITSLYGMNIKNLPSAENPTAFIIILGIMAVVAISMLMFFRIKRWL